MKRKILWNELVKASLNFLYKSGPNLLKHFTTQITNVPTEWSSVSIKALVIGKFLKERALPLPLEFASKPLKSNLQVLTLLPYAPRQRKPMSKLLLGREKWQELSTVRHVLTSETLKLWKMVWIHLHMDLDCFTMSFKTELWKMKVFSLYLKLCYVSQNCQNFSKSLLCSKLIKILSLILRNEAKQMPWAQNNTYC